MRRALACALACAGLLGFAAPGASAGTPWKAVGQPQPLASIAFAPSAGSSRVYAKNGLSFWRSDDDGATWSTAGPVQHTEDCHLRVSSLDPNVVYSGCGTVSDDGGAHWYGLPTLSGSLQIDAAGTLYGTNERGSLYRCTPDAFTCTAIVTSDYAVLIVDPASAGVLARQANGALTVSTDGGVTWSAARALPPHFLGVDIGFDGQVPGKLVIVGPSDVQTRLLAVSANLGQTWGTAHQVPLPYDAEDTIRAGGSGAQRRIWIQAGGNAVWTNDDGATFHAVAPVSGALVVDPGDGAHVFAGDDASELWESRDAAATWTLRNSTQFGISPFYRITGGGSALYGISNWWGVWYSQDAGATWQRPPALVGAQVHVIAASPDDPRVAYAWATAGSTVGFWQTVDGGHTWTARTAPPGGFGVDGWVQRGHPDWVFATSIYSQPLLGSHDGGRTWGPEPASGICGFGVAFAVPDTAHGMAACGGAFALAPSLAPWDQAFSASEYLLTDHTGGGAMYSLEPVGRINGDWSFDAFCGPSTKYCQLLHSAGGVYGQQIDPGLPAGWVADGHATFAVATTFGLWAMRDGGRWWQLTPPAGSDAALATPAPLVLLGASQLIWSGLRVALEAPDAVAPALAVAGSQASCSTTVPATAATVAWGWRLDGSSIAGSAAATHAIGLADQGHVLSCVVTLSNAWGAATAASSGFRVPGAATALRRRLALTGTATVGDLLRCGATRGIGWLRGAKLLKGEHGRTYRVVASDEGHALACQSHPAGGALERSPAVRIPKPHGGRAVLVAARP